MKAIKGGRLPAKKNETDEMLKSIAEMIKGSLGNPKPNTTGISYSSLLLQLIKPYQQDSENIILEELEYLLDIGMAAWNLAVYKKKNNFMYQTYLDAITSDELMDNESKKLLHNLVADKEKLYGEYNDMMLEDFEITEDKNGKTIVNVISKSLDAFIAESISGDFFDEDDDEDDNDDEIPSYILPVVNRNAILVKPKAPFLEWVRKIYFPEQPPGLQNHENIYMYRSMKQKKALQNL